MGKYDFIYNLASTLLNASKKMTGGELANELNNNGYKTTYHAKYKGGRGTYKLIRSAYKYFEKNGMPNKADEIARAFVKKNGKYAYK